jgi:amino acid transporter
MSTASDHSSSRLLSLLRPIIGGKREIDSGVFHRVSLVAFLAWVGLGADGLSSSVYGPEEAFKALGGETYLAVLLAAATTFTVLIIAYSYSRLIEAFPLGGGGYVVATRLLGSNAGVVSGSALVIDYVLTIAISIAAGADAIFSFVGPYWSADGGSAALAAKLPLALLAILLLILLNLRGVKESVALLAPIFLVFLFTHAVLIVGVILSRAAEIPVVAAQVAEGFSRGITDPPVGLGAAGMIALFLRAYSMGAGTYTGIEAVSNGLSIMREPKVQTGKRTMALMAASLALTAGGLILAYLLAHVRPVEGMTMNAVLARTFAAGMDVAGVPIGGTFVFVTLLSEAALLVVAAQAGFIDGPRVMANMATDSWLPHRFSQLSDRLTMHYGVLLMGGASVVALWYTAGNVTHLVVMYSINVFVTFSLSQLAMCRYWLKEGRGQELWRRRLSVHAICLALCAFILAATVYEKFGEGGWITISVTATFVGLCFAIRRHYRTVAGGLRRLDEIVETLPAAGATAKPGIEPSLPTAVLLVGSYAGLGIHTLLSIERLFPRHFHNYMFVAVGVIDSASFVNVAAVDEVRERTERELKQYVALAERLGLAADYRMAIDNEVTGAAIVLCEQVAAEFPRSIFFAGKLVFERESWYQRLLHNETAYQLQRSLQFAGLNAMVLPTRILETAA